MRVSLQWVRVGDFCTRVIKCKSATLPILTEQKWLIFIIKQSLSTIHPIPVAFYYYSFKSPFCYQFDQVFHTILIKTCINVDHIKYFIFSANIYQHSQLLWHHMQLCMSTSTACSRKLAFVACYFVICGVFTHIWHLHLFH